MAADRLGQHADVSRRFVARPGDVPHHLPRHSRGPDAGRRGSSLRSWQGRGAGRRGAGGVHCRLGLWGSADGGRPLQASPAGAQRGDRHRRERARRAAHARFDGVPEPRRAQDQVSGSRRRQGALLGRLRHQHQRRRRSLSVEPSRPADDRRCRGVGCGDLSRDRRLGDRAYVGRRADGSRTAGRRPCAHPRDRAGPPRRSQRARSSHTLGGAHQIHPDACRVPADHDASAAPTSWATPSRPRSGAPSPTPR